MKSIQCKNILPANPTKSPFFQKEGNNNFFENYSKLFFNTSPIQAKLTVNQPNDPYEKEADGMADKVAQNLNDKTFSNSENNSTPFFNNSNSLVQRKCATCEHEEKLQKKEEVEEKDLLKSKLQKKPIFESNAQPSDDEKNIQRKCASCEKEEKLQKKDDTTSSQTASPNIESSLNNSKGSGSSLPKNTREQMESSFGADFSGVRIHNDGSAAEMSKNLHSQAFTHGRDIYFNSGKYDTNANSGKHLLAHELTHVLQQGSNSQTLNTEKSNPIIQCQVINQRSGRTVGVTPSQNIREEVLSTLDRLHELWSITNQEYSSEYGLIQAFSQGANISPTQMPLTIAAIRRNEQPHIHPIVARNFLAINLSDTVGVGMVNNKNDILLVQRIVRAHGLLSEANFNIESAAVASLSSTSVPISVIPQTLSALSILKQKIAGGTMGWAPIHADELRYGPQDDKFGARTFQFNQFSVFVPSGAAMTSLNNVHVFFSPGGAQGESGLNAVLHHGLRGTSETSQWILIGVPGAEPGFVTISTQQILDCLTFVGRAAQINGLRLSAHSRGYRGLRETVGQRLINTALVSRVVIFDANYQSIANTLSRSGISPGIVTAYNVGSGTLPLPGSTTRFLNPKCMRAIGYTRLIRDAMVTMPNLVVPPAISNQLLNLPPRGTFSTLTSPPLPLVNIGDFCNRNRSAINTMINNEANRTTGLKTFFDNNNLGRFVDNGTQLIFAPGIYSHHFFVSELAHEVTD